MGSLTQLGQNTGHREKIRLTVFFEKNALFNKEKYFSYNICHRHPFIDANPRAKRNGIQPPCIDFRRVAQHGNYVGNCLSMDSKEMYFCYVRKVANACPS